jgi:hypothetical protein
MLDDNRRGGSVTIAIIGLIGALGASVLANWDKIFSHVEVGVELQPSTSAPFVAIAGTFPDLPTANERVRVLGRKGVTAKVFETSDFSLLAKTLPYFVSVGSYSTADAAMNSAARATVRDVEPHAYAKQAL